MRIRSADPARDAAGCAALYAPYVRDTVISLEELAPSPAEMAERIARISATHPWLVAEAEPGWIVGFAYGCPHRERAAYRWAADVTVYVDGEARGSGVGRALYGALLPLLDRQGVSSACAGITLPNPASVGIHEAFGFEPVGVYRRIGFKDGAWRDVGWWQLQLGERDDRPPAELEPPHRL